MAFVEGDIVRQKGGDPTDGSGDPRGLVGRVCKVVTPGLSYKVRFGGMPMCLLELDRDLERAKGPAPECITHPSCQ